MQIQIQMKCQRQYIKQGRLDPIPKQTQNKPNHDRARQIFTTNL